MESSILRKIETSFGPEPDLDSFDTEDGDTLKGKSFVEETCSLFLGDECFRIGLGHVEISLMQHCYPGYEDLFIRCYKKNQEELRDPQESQDATKGTTARDYVASVHKMEPPQMRRSAM